MFRPRSEIHVGTEVWREKKEDGVHFLKFTYVAGVLVFQEQLTFVLSFNLPYNCYNMLF